MTGPKRGKGKRSTPAVEQEKTTAEASEAADRESFPDTERPPEPEEAREKTLLSAGVDPQPVEGASDDADEESAGESGAHTERRMSAAPVTMMSGAAENDDGEEQAPLSQEAAMDAPDFDPSEIPGDLETSEIPGDLETTVNLAGDVLKDLPIRDDFAEPSDGEPDTNAHGELAPAQDVSRAHLKGLLEALVFVSDHPIKPHELAKTAAAGGKEVRELLLELKEEYAPRGVQLDEVAGGWLFRTNPQYAPFVRDLTKQRPVKLSRAQVETLAILAYRQPITRPEIDEIRGVDSGATLKLLLDRDLVKILGRKDEPGRPILYGTTTQFLEFFGLKSLKDLPTLKEFTELNEDSRRVVELELGDVLDARQPEPPEAIEPGVGSDLPDAPENARDTLLEADSPEPVTESMDPEAREQANDEEAKTDPPDAIAPAEVAAAEVAPPDPLATSLPPDPDTSPRAS